MLRLTATMLTYITCLARTPTPTPNPTRTRYPLPHTPYPLPPYPCHPTPTLTPRLLELILPPPLNPTPCRLECCKAGSRRRIPQRESPAGSGLGV